MAEELLALRGRPEPPALIAEERTDHEPMLAASVRVLRRRKLLALAVLVAFTVPAAVFVKRRPPVYQATARLLIERNDATAGVMKDGQNTPLPGDDFFQTQTRLFSSRPNIVKAIEATKLWEAPQFAPAQPFSRDAEQMSLLVDKFLEHLSVVPTFGTHLLNVTFEASDPALAANAVNALVDAYVTEHAASQAADSSKVMGWIDTRLAEQQQRLAASEAALQTYMETHDAVSVQDRQNIVVQKLSDLNAALTRAKTERMAKQVLYDQLKAARTDPGALDSVPIILSNPVLQQLRAQLAELKQKELATSQELGERHPEMIKLRAEMDLTAKRLDAELAALSDSVSKDFLAAQAIENGLVQALDAQKHEVVELNQKSLDYGALQRDAASNRQIYERLLSEARTRGVTAKPIDGTIRVVESAERPVAPVGPPNRRDLLLALAAGLLLAVSVPLSLESLDYRVKTPADIEQRLRVACIAMVPKVRGTMARKPLMTHGTNNFSEAFRRIRAAICVSNEPQAALRLLVTSAVPGEGKSLVAANIAVAFARAGQRVLLIDADLRRPTIHDLFEMKAAPGFTNVLHRDAGAEALHVTSIPNLFVLPSGSRQPDAAELLSSPDLDAVLSVFDRKFNLIVFDSPPVGPVADACNLARLAPQAIVVVAAGSTSAAAASNALDQLTAAGTKVVGVVLNRVDLDRSAYYYGPYHHQHYGAYYA